MAPAHAAGDQAEDRQLQHPGEELPGHEAGEGACPALSTPILSPPPSSIAPAGVAPLLSLCIPGAFGIPGYPWPRGGHVASSVCSYISEHLYQQWKGGQRLKSPLCTCRSRPWGSCTSVGPDFKATHPTKYHVPKFPAAQRGDTNAQGLVQPR